MLKHEEMIENVHRRIAQYEEEKKMKHSKFKNIFSTTKPDSKNEVNTSNEDGYIEVVSGTERIKTSNRMIRIVSTVAACSVLAAGIGATGVLLNKNKANRAALSDEDVVCTEAPETTVYKLTDDGAISPFIDFRQLYFTIGNINNFEYVEYSDTTYNNLAIFLNNFNWGEGTDISEDKLPDFNNYGGNGYMIDWRKGDVWFYVYVTDDGKAYYYRTKCQADGGSFYYPISDCYVYDIDFETFDKGVKDIWGNDVPDTSEYISKREQKYLTQGEFMNATVDGKGDLSLGESVPESDKSSAALQGFLREDFVGMLQKSDYVESYGDIKFYEVVCYYKTSDTTTRRLTYYIHGDGTVSLCEYELTENASIPTGTTNYRIDVKELENILNDILNGKYDDKYSVVETTTAVTTSTAKTTTVTTSVQENAPEETDGSAPEKSEEEKELLDTAYKSIVGNDFYYNTINNDGFEHMTDNGMVDFKNVINYMIYEAENLNIDRELGEITDEQDAIEKARYVLLNIKGEEYMDWLEKEPAHDPEIEYYRENPHIIAHYYDEYGIWYIYPTSPSWISKDGSGPNIVSWGGGHTILLIRGCDGKILGCLLNY